MTQILACIDASIYAASVCDLAAWAATRLSAGIEVLHVVQRKSAVTSRHDLSGAIGLGVKSSLLEELTRIEEAESKLAVEQGRALLNSAEQRLRNAGIEDVRQLHRHGGIVETIIEREADADLVVIGKRGASGGFATDHMGSKIERVVRASNKPVLVAAREGLIPQTAVVAFDGSTAASKAVDCVATSALFADLDIHLVMAGPGDASHRGRLEKAASRFTDRKTKAVTVLAQGSAEKVIGDYMAEHADGLLVLGAYGHSPLRALIVGSTTTAMIRSVQAALLLVR